MIVVMIAPIAPFHTPKSGANPRVPLVAMCHTSWLGTKDPGSGGDTWLEKAELAKPPAQELLSQIEANTPRRGTRSPASSPVSPWPPRVLPPDFSRQGRRL
jgi:hypothetical protein